MERKLWLQGKIDGLKTQFISQATESWNPSKSKSFFYFNQEVQANLDKEFRVFVHHRKSNSAEIEILNYYFDPETIFQLFNNKNKLVERMTAEELVQYHQKKEEN